MSRDNFSTDRIMKLIMHGLVTDLSPSEVRIDAGFLKALQEGDIEALRMRTPDMNYYVSCGSYDFKKIWQLANFSKRWIFMDEQKNYGDLEDRAWNSFKESQSQFGPRLERYSTQRVILRAQSIMARLLGKFEWDEFSTLCKWGKRAANGLPARLAYLDTRCSRVSGTRFQLNALNFVLRGDEKLREAVTIHSCNVDLGGIGSVTYTTVPKTWKAVRGIAPDTIAGGFLSQGLGRLLRKRLEAQTPINLKTGKEKHMRLAREASVNQHLVTADMEKASDSFTWEHIKMLFPVDWRPIMYIVRTPAVRKDSDAIRLQSYMLMGSGHTFPCQTLIFYVLLKSIMELTGISGTLSVFGDDLIYPTRLHRYVIGVFDDLGLRINVGKTFSDGPFRESCGGDYHRGLDVRPFMPSGMSEKTTKNGMIAFLHYLMNGLLDKWTHHEIPATVALLHGELAKLCPDGIATGLLGVDGKYSSILHEVPSYFSLKKAVYKYEGYVPTRTYKTLRLRSKKRKPFDIRPYYWDSLRAAYDIYGDVYEPDCMDVAERPAEAGCDATWKKSEARKGQATGLGSYRWQTVTTCLSGI